MVTQIIIILVCLIMSAYFSATETAFSTFNRIRMKSLGEDGNKRAALALRISEDYDTMISTVLIGNNIVNILASAIATILFTDIMMSADLGATVSTVVMTVIVLIFGEITPKTMAKNSPEKFAMFSAPLMRMLLVIFKPLSFVFKKWQDTLAKLSKNDEDKGMTEEELISIIEEAEEEGDINEEESSLIKSAIEFGDLAVEDILTPRIDITAISADTAKADVAKMFTDSGYSRVPVYEGELDNVIGILYYKDFYKDAYETDLPITEIIKPAIFVAKTQKVNDLMKELQEKQLHMAIVTDEYGSTAGLVTLEDILEQIVGDIWDEHDEVVEEIKCINEKEYIVSGKANTEKLFSTLDIDEEADSVTVNGWAMEALEKIPEVGDEFEAFGLSVKVLEMDGRRIENVQVIDNRPDETDEEETKRDKKSQKDNDDKDSESESENE